MSWWIFQDTIQALNTVGEVVELILNTVIDLPNQITVFIVKFAIAALYPLGLLLYFLQNIHELAYTAFLPFLNLQITILNIPITILSLFTSIPSVWIMILYTSIMLCVSIRVYKWIWWVLRKTPFWSIVWGDKP